MHAIRALLVIFLTSFTNAFVFEHRLPVPSLHLSAARIKPLKSTSDEFGELGRRKMRELESIIDSIASLSKSDHFPVAGSIGSDEFSIDDSVIAENNKVTPSQMYYNLQKIVKKAQSAIDDDNSRYFKKDLPQTEDQSIPFEAINNSRSSKMEDHDFSPVVYAPELKRHVLSRLGRVVSSYRDISTLIQTKLPTLAVRTVITAVNSIHNAVKGVLHILWSVISPPLSVLSLALTNALLWNYAINYTLVHGPKYLPAVVMSFIQAQDLWIASPAYLIAALGWMIWGIGNQLLVKNRGDSCHQLVNGIQAVLYCLLRCVSLVNTK